LFRCPEGLKGNLVKSESGPAAVIPIQNPESSADCDSGIGIQASIIIVEPLVEKYWEG